MDPSLFATFAEVERTHWWFTGRQEILLTVAERFVPSGAPVLDVGCGTGLFVERAGERYEAWGVDPSPVAVELCRSRGLERVVQGSAYDLSAVPARRFAAVLLLDVIEHLDDEEAALKESLRVLAPGGIVVVTVPAFMALWSEHDVLNEHRRRYRRGQLGRLLQRVGIRIERLTYFNAHLFPLAAVDRLAHRLTGRPVRAHLRVPPLWINALMRRAFQSERHRVADPTRAPYRFGVSALAVGRWGGAPGAPNTVNR